MKVFIAVIIGREEADGCYIEAFSTRELAEKYIEDVKNDTELHPSDFDGLFDSWINESTVDEGYTA